MMNMILNHLPFVGEILQVADIVGFTQFHRSKHLWSHGNIVDGRNPAPVGNY